MCRWIKLILNKLIDIGLTFYFVPSWPTEVKVTDLEMFVKVFIKVLVSVYLLNVDGSRWYFS